LNVHQLRERLLDELDPAAAMVVPGGGVPRELFVQLKGVGDSFDDAVDRAGTLVREAGAPVVAMFDNLDLQTASFMLAGSEWPDAG
jgi:hypothetical protein